MLEEGEGWRKSPCTQCTCTAKGLNCEKIDLYNLGVTCLKLVKEYSIKEVIIVLYTPITFLIYRAFNKLPQIYTANHATFPIQMYAITGKIS